MLFGQCYEQALHADGKKGGQDYVEDQIKQEQFRWNKGKMFITLFHIVKRDCCDVPQFHRGWEFVAFMEYQLSATYRSFDKSQKKHGRLRY